jgi:hypothetical protein
MQDSGKADLLVGVHAILLGIATDGNTDPNVVDRLRPAVSLLDAVLKNLPSIHLDGTPGTYAEAL